MSLYLRYVSLGVMTDGKEDDAGKEDGDEDILNGLRFFFFKQDSQSICRTSHKYTR